MMLRCNAGKAKPNAEGLRPTLSRLSSPTKRAVTRSIFHLLCLGFLVVKIAFLYVLIRPATSSCPQPYSFHEWQAVVTTYERK